MYIKRLVAQIDRYLLRRALPHGIISWRYLLPNPPPNVHFHRQLWLLGRHPRLPLPLFLLGELFLWLRWVTFSCWRKAWRMARLRGTEINRREGISTATQLWRLLALGLCHCIPPREVYAFGLYRSDAKFKIWDYVFVHETQAFHRWRSARQGDAAESMVLIQDKFRLANLLGDHGIPMAPVLELVPRGAMIEPSSHLTKYPRLFCKPRHGSASKDAFIIERNKNDRPPAVFAVTNGMKTLESSLNELHSAVERDDFLVQPLLTNHPELAPLSGTEDVITVRIITELDPIETRCYSAILEIPGTADTLGIYHIILPVDLSSGQVLRLPEELQSSKAQARHDAMIASIGHYIVPFWDEIRTSAIAAHQHLPGLFAIAWDYVITPEGPCMLEGNSGWGLTTPQILYGGLLQKSFGSSD